MPPEIEKKAFREVFLSPFSFLPFIAGCTMLLLSSIGPWQLLVGGIWAILGSIGIIAYRYAKLDKIVEKVINRELRNKENEKWKTIEDKIYQISKSVFLRDDLLKTLSRIRGLYLENDDVLRQSLDDCCDQVLLLFKNHKNSSVFRDKIERKIRKNIDSINQAVNQIIESKVDNVEFKEELEKSLEITAEIRNNTKKFKDLIEE